MAINSPPQLMRVNELLDLPERRFVERTLIRGELRERKVTYRNAFHSTVLGTIVFLLEYWLRSQSRLQAIVATGDAGFLLRQDPDSVVGIDAAIVLRGTPLYRRRKRVIFDGAPLLAVEVLSPSDRQDDVETKVDEYLKSGVQVVWIVSPGQRTLTVFRPDAEPQLFSESQEFVGEPHLPGLTFKVAELFAKMPDLPG